MAKIVFPNNPSVGLTYVASDRHLYYWTGSSWKDLGLISSGGSTEGAGGDIVQLKPGTNVTFGEDGTINVANQVQTDFEEYDPESKSYIKNKPSGFAVLDDIKFDVLQANKSVGTEANQLAFGNHDHDIEGRAKAALHATVTGITYDKLTGIFAESPGYRIPLTTKQTEWDEAFSWGDHAGLYAPISHVGSGGSVHSSATPLQSGFMSSMDKGKLDGVEEYANNYLHPVKAWVDKPNLSAASIVSNLSIDASGHLINWSTRNLTAGDIGAAAVDHGDHGLATHAASSTAHPRDTRNEISFTKNTAFNKDFGTAAGTISEGNHSHSTLYAALSHGDHGLATHTLLSDAHPRDIRNQIAGSYASSTHNHSGVYEPIFNKGSIIQGSGVTLAGTLTGRLYGTGDITITNADKGSSQSIFKNISNSAGTTQFSAGSNNDSIRFEGSGATSVSFDATTKKVTISSTDNNTTYSEISEAESDSTTSATGRLITGRRLNSWADRRGVTLSNISAWNTAYGWGDHSGLYSLSVHYHGEIRGSGLADLNTLPSTVGGLDYRNFSGTALNKPTAGNNANGVISMTSHSGPYGKQIAFADNDDLYIRRITANSFGAWLKLWHAGNFDPSTKLDSTAISTWAKAATKPSYTYTEVGAAPAHSHPYLPLTGGTLTGTNPEIRFLPTSANDAGGIRYTYSNNDGAMEFWTSDDYTEPFVWRAYDVGMEGTGTFQEWMKLVSNTLYVGGQAVVKTDDSRLTNARTPSNDSDIVHKSGTETISGAKTFSSPITSFATSSRDHLRVWTSNEYTIGMQGGFTFGGLVNEYAMTFQMSNMDTRGFWWGDSSHGQGSGAMALTTSGLLTVARGIRVGYGESDAVVPTDSVLDVSGNILSSGTVKAAKVDMAQAWSSSVISSNSLFVNNASGGFAFGVGTSVSSWFSYNGTVRRAVDVWHDGSKVDIHTNLVVAGYTEVRKHVEVKNDSGAEGFKVEWNDTDKTIDFIIN